MVKIDTSSPILKAVVRKTGKSSELGSMEFADSIGEQQFVENLSSVSGAANATQALLSLQEAGEKDAVKSYGDKILSYLDAIRLDLLTGNFKDDQLLSLRKFLVDEKIFVADQRLKQVIDEITQRANIELAKRGLI